MFTIVIFLIASFCVFIVYAKFILEPEIQRVKVKEAATTAASDAIKKLLTQ